jgi:phosphoribosylanthranilate isomerase
MLKGSCLDLDKTVFLWKNTSMIPDVKICGLKTLETLEAALVNGASHVGFVFFKKSPRNISLPLAASLRDSVKGRAHVVCVTVDADNMLLDEIVYQVKPDMLQLHGAETPRRVLEIKRRYEVSVIKAIPVYDESDLLNIVPYQGIADRILFDAKLSSLMLPGGNGVSFNWQMLDVLDEKINYMLSGGLRVNNVVKALLTTRAKGIDVSSGVETELGVKDVHMIKAFLDKALSAISEGGDFYDTVI